METDCFQVGRTLSLGNQFTLEKVTNFNNIPTTMSTTRLLEVQFNKIMWLISISNKTIQNLQNEITKTNKSIKLKNSELKKLKQKRVRKYKSIQEK